MGPETKQKAIDKLNAISVKIAYPEKWQNFDDVQINRSTLYKNMQEGVRHMYRLSLSKINNPLLKLIGTCHLFPDTGIIMRRTMKSVLP
jgi:putative endopeptidase